MDTIISNDKVENNNETEQELLQRELVSLIKTGSEISTEEALEDVVPVSWSDEVLAGNYKDQTIIKGSNESGKALVLK